jgi:hypothetical protein
MSSCCPPGCLLCYANRRGRSNYKGHWGFRRPPVMRKDNVMSILRRASSSPVDTDGLIFWPGPEGSEAYPALHEFLLMDKWDDGNERVTGTIILFLDGNRIKLMLNDKDCGRVGVVSGRSVYECLEAADAALEDDAVDWRKSRDGKDAGRRKN